MEKYESEAKYNRQIREAFKSADEPEILIVVSEAADGLRCAAQHRAQSLQAAEEHNLLQAIARVNRLFE